MSSYRLMNIFLWAYPVIWACLLCGFVYLMWRFIKTYRARFISEAMMVFFLLFYFFAIGRYSLAKVYGGDTIEVRFGAAAIAVSMIMHIFTCGVEEYIRWKRASWREMSMSKDD